MGMRSLVILPDLSVGFGKISGVMIAVIVVRIMVRRFGARTQMSKTMANLGKQKASAQDEREQAGWDSRTMAATHGNQDSEPPGIRHLWPFQDPSRPSAGSSDR